MAAKRKGVVVRLTALEADMLSSVAGNGWGNGDFANWLADTDDRRVSKVRSKARIKACERAMEKLDRARQAQRDGSAPKNERR